MKTDKRSEIRFSKSEGNWQEYKLGEIYTERKEKGQESLPILTVSISKGISDGELDNNGLGKLVVRSEDKSLYKHVYPGDLVLNMMRAWQGAYGVVTSEGMVSPAYITATPNNQVSPPFMDYCLRRDEMISQINNLSYGVTDFRKRLYWKSFIKISCHIPSIPEQKRITSFLTKLDKLIIIHQQELVALKQTKQGFLQKMFPKEGKSAPDIRFPGFTGEWIERKLGEISHKVKDKNLEGIYSETLTNSAEFGIVNQREFFDKDISNKKNLGGYYVVCPDDFVYNPRISNLAPVGPIKRNKLGRTGVMSPLYYVFRSKGVDKQYLENYFSSTNWHEFMKLNGDSGARSDRFAIKDSVFCEMPIPLPSLGEQAKIGDFFKQFDDTIALHQKELETLKKTKKAFLQKVFV